MGGELSEPECDSNQGTVVGHHPLWLTRRGRAVIEGGHIDRNKARGSCHRGMSILALYEE